MTTKIIMIIVIVIIKCYDPVTLTKVSQLFLKSNFLKRFGNVKIQTT